MLTVIIAAYITTIAIFLSCVAVALIGGQRRGRIELRRLEREIDAVADWLRTGQKVGR